jgi:hypothetical protein
MITPICARDGMILKLVKGLGPIEPNRARGVWSAYKYRVPGIDAVRMVFVRRPDFEIRPRQDYFECGNRFVLRARSRINNVGKEKHDMWQAALVSRLVPSKVEEAGAAESRRS